MFLGGLIECSSSVLLGSVAYGLSFLMVQVASRCYWKWSWGREEDTNGGFTALAQLGFFDGKQQKPNSGRLAELKNELQEDIEGQ